MKQKKLFYFPLIIDRWRAGTQELTFEERGYYFSLLVWMYDTQKAVKNSDHASKILHCDKRTSRRLWAKVRPKFRLTSAGLRHKLVDEVIRNGGKIRGLQGAELPIDLDPDPDLSISEDRDTRPQTEKRSEDTCPHQAIIDLYHKHTRLRRVRTWNGQRPGLLRSMWKQFPDLEWWTGFFDYVNESDFLCGRSEQKNGSQPFAADLEWLIRPNNFQKIHEGKYHDVQKTSSRRH